MSHVAVGWLTSAESGRFIPHGDRRTKDTIHKELNDDVIYRPGQLDRDVVAKDQIRLPGRTEVPKMLIFAKNDQHAEDIVDEVREVFGKGNEFCASGRSPHGTALASIPVYSPARFSDA